MNSLNVAADPSPAIQRAIDEIAFHASMLALHSAVTGAGDSPELPGADAQAAHETLVLLEESVSRSRYTQGPIEAGEDRRCVAERMRRIGGRSALIPVQRLPEHNTSFGDVR